jgi:hypothetical protein
MNSPSRLNDHPTRQNRFSPTVAPRFLFACSPAPAQFSFDGRYEPKRGLHQTRKGTTHAGARRGGIEFVVPCLVFERYSTPY